MGMLPMIRLVDCTIRDGGYRTGWLFDEQMILGYLNICRRLLIDWIEIGYLRIAPSGLDEGSWGDLTRKLTPLQRRHLQNSSDLPFAVMLDASEASAFPPRDAAKKIIEQLRVLEIPVNMIRIATKANDLPFALDLVSEFADFGIGTMINLMQASLLDCDDLAFLLAGSAGRMQPLVLYIADSFGGMVPDKVIQLVQTLRTAVPGETGFHAHDNFGLAVANSLAAVSAGASYIDMTMGGIGRGAGNAATESILPVLRPALPLDTFDELDRFLCDHLKPLRYPLPWGTSGSYRWQARRSIHPSYAQNLAECSDLTEQTHFEILDKLAKLNSKQFNSTALSEVIAAVLAR